MKSLITNLLVLCFTFSALAISAQTKSYKVGDYYDDGVKKGIVFQVSDDGQHGKIISLEQTKLRWCNRSTATSKGGNQVTKAHNLDDGEVNTDIVMALDGAEDYLAFVWCRQMGKEWYLPSVRELIAIHAAKKPINQTIKEQRVDKLSGVWFFSSSEIGPEFATKRGSYSKNFAWVVSMTAGQPSHMAKDEHTVNVRAVAKF